MDDAKLRQVLRHLLTVTVYLLAIRVYAGGSGLNTIVIVNQNSSNSVALGNYYCERRQVPPENLLRITWTGGHTYWTADEFRTNLLNPLLALVVARDLTNQIDYVALSMDIPYMTYNGAAINSTTSALFYGLKSDTDSTWAGVTNSYAASERPFYLARPASAPGYSFLATMMTADSLALAKSFVDQGVASDGTFPAQTVLLEKSTDPTRNVRYHWFDDAIFNTRLRGNYAMARTNGDTVAGLTGLLGFQTGLAAFNVTYGMFVPGAMADSMTSYGGQIFEGGQTSVLAFIRAGASGSYGTVTEPTPNPDKFPNPQNYFYQARGFALAECYYQSLVVPYQGITVGEPLAAPFQLPAWGRWHDISSNAVLTGIASIPVQFNSIHPERPLQQVDLFVDGKYARTLTNLPPQAGNVLNLNLNGTALAFTVPANATLASIAAGVAALINAPATTNVTRTLATVHGDRIEISSGATNRALAPMNFRVTAGPGSTNASVAVTAPIVASSAGTAAWSSTFLSASRATFLDSPVTGVKGCNVNGTLQIGTWLQIVVTKTNGAQVSLAVTNQTPNGTPLSLTADLAALINSTPSLLGPDGLVAEDLAGGFFGSAVFNCRARSPGYRAAGIKMVLNSSGSLVLVPPSETSLDDGITDLRPRNHLFVTAGATNLDFAFPLDTSGLADGFHELTVVAYEGSHVRTQTKITLPVQVRNSAVSATLTLLDLPNPAPVQGTYHLQVAANTNTVTRIRLFTTGGVLDAVTNQATAIFTVGGGMLGEGLHAFYAIVETSEGPSYRVQPQSVRLAP